MNIRKIGLALLSLLVLVSCNKEEETYEKRDVEVESVFDEINNGESKEDKQEEDKPKDTEEDQNNKEDQTQDNNAGQNNENPENTPTDDNVDNMINNDQNNQANPPADNYGRKQTTATVNMRSTPNANIDNLVESVPGDAYVTVVEEQNINGISWSKVTYQGQTGYIRSDLLR